jgi:hypothetical protein
VHISRIWVLKYVWAWWRYREARLQRGGQLPPVIEQFAEGELIPLKGFTFRVAHRGEHGIVLAPVGFTGAMRKRLVSHLKEHRHVAQPKAV